MSIGLYIVLAPLYLKSVRKLQEKRFVFVKILAIIIPENGAKVSKIKCFQFAQQTLNKYTAEGRKEIHKQLETVDIERVHELMRNPISNETVEFNDNCVSLFVAQRGKCAICKLPLTLENMRCVRKIPKSCGGDDKYNNLIIVHKEMERLIKSQDNKEIKRILNKYKLESNQRRKVNTIRKNAGLEEIDVKALDKEL